MLDNLNRENVQKYMKKLEEAGAKDEHTEKYGLSSIEKIAYSLENGSLIIPEVSLLSFRTLLLCLKRHHHH